MQNQHSAIFFIIVNCHLFQIKLYTVVIQGELNLYDFDFLYVVFYSGEYEFHRKTLDMFTLSPNLLAEFIVLA